MPRHPRSCTTTAWASCPYPFTRSTLPIQTRACVRCEISRNLSWQPATAFQRVRGIVQRLAQDADEEIRRSLAFEFNNMSDLPQLLSIAQHMAESDPSSEVRNDAMPAIAALMRPEQAIAYYQSRFQHAAQDESMMWAFSTERVVTVSTRMQSSF